MNKKFVITEKVTSISKQPLVEIIGKRRVLIENHSGITEMSNDRITASNDGGNIVITGKDLQLVMMSVDQIVVAGQIESVLLDAAV